MMNLGTAFRRLPSGAGAENVFKSVQCYRQALRVYTLQDFPARYGNVCNNLGNACLSFPARDRRSLKHHVRHAIRHFERALAVWNSEKSVCRRALVQYNLGFAYLCLGDVERAVACLSEASESSGSCGRPDIADLARAQLKKIPSAFKEQSQQAR